LNTRKLLKIITDKWPVKVLSIAAAVILLVFHEMSIQETRNFSTIIQMELSDELIPAGSYTQLVKVSLRGNASGIYSISEDDIEAYIDIRKNTKEGMNRLPVQIRKKGNALKVEPLEITVDPIEITLMLERKR